MTDTQHEDAMAQLALCFRLCEECAADCIDQGGASLAQCIKLCLACADSCRLCMKAISYDLAHRKEVCRVCAQLCDDCADECEKG
jgi:hypothetical protein